MIWGTSIFRNTHLYPFKTCQNIPHWGYCHATVTDDLLRGKWEFNQGRVGCAPTNVPYKKSQCKPYITWVFLGYIIPKNPKVERNYTVRGTRTLVPWINGEKDENSPCHFGLKNSPNSEVRFSGQKKYEELSELNGSNCLFFLLLSPIPSMWLVYLVYLPTWIVDFYGKLVGKYTVRPHGSSGVILGKLVTSLRCLVIGWVNRIQL